MQCKKCGSEIEYAVVVSDEYIEAMTNEHHEENAFCVVSRCPDCGVKITEELVGIEQNLKTG